MKKITMLLAPIAMVVMGVMFSKDYFFSNLNDKDIQKFTALVEDGKKTKGVLAEEYEESTTKIAGVKMKTYNVSYTYTVDGNEIQTEETISSLPDSKEVEVTYNPEDITVSTLGEPAEMLAKAKERSESTMGLWMGILLVVGGIGLGIFRLKRAV